MSVRGADAAAHELRHSQLDEQPLRDAVAQKTGIVADFCNASRLVTASAEEQVLGHTMASASVHVAATSSPFSPCVLPSAENRHPLVCVFGSAHHERGDPLYGEALALGTALAREGFGVVSGGYAGLMEGVSEGAAAGGVPVVGVLVQNIFGAQGNAFLTEAVSTSSLLSRIDTMVQRAASFIVLPGTLGTLVELVAVLNIATLAPLGEYEPPLIVAWRDPWHATLAAVESTLRTPPHLAAVTFVGSVEEAVAATVEYHGRKRGDGSPQAEVAQGGRRRAAQPALATSANA